MLDRSADLPLVDPATLEQLRTLNEATKGDFLKRVVDLYSEHAPSAIAQLRQDVDAGDAEACGALAHSLKSMSLNIGAIEVAKLAAGFEQMARDDGKVPGQNELDMLSNTLERTLAVLTRETGEEHVSQQTVETQPCLAGV